MQYIEITRVVSLRTRIPFDSNHYPDMTIDQAIAYEKSEEGVAGFIEDLSYAHEDDYSISTTLSVIDVDNTK